MSRWVLRRGSRGSMPQGDAAPADFTLDGTRIVRVTTGWKPSTPILCSGTRTTRIHRCGRGLRRSNDMTRGAQHGFTPVASFGQNASIAAARSRPARAPRKHPSDPRSLETDWRDPRPVAREIRVIRVVEREPCDPFPWDRDPPDPRPVGTEIRAIRASRGTEIRVIRVPWDRDPRDQRRVGRDRRDPRPVGTEIRVIRVPWDRDPRDPRPLGQRSA